MTEDYGAGMTAVTYPSWVNTALETDIPGRQAKTRPIATITALALPITCGICARLAFGLGTTSLNFIHSRAETGKNYPKGLPRPRT